ncbi:general stress protein [Sphingomonas ginkgonis]|uniref:General stress protein n=1 Tax=Sphingomonas ginkgonis TaxID=2315330 RepID=A0A3R9YJ61_9SPHN|nr:pyridoxamine 5'-phosphate oxidase family protein [Sphingomonas ginkgonis]RST31115.1 general stress protein [Sphingomonas ginkgonis]
MAEDPNRDQEIREKFWKELDSSPFMMLGLEGVEDDRTRPMTAQVDQSDDAATKDGGTIYFFGSKSDGVGRDLTGSHRAVATYTAKGHDLFAHIHGRLVPVQDRAIVEKLWNPMIAAWYKDGKDDPDLQLMRFDTEKAQIWEAHTGTSLVAAALRFVGRGDPGKELSKQTVTEVAL